MIVRQWSKWSDDNGDYQLRTVERWIRRNRRRVTTLDKFCETGWRYYHHNDDTFHFDYDNDDDDRPHILRWTFYTFIHMAGIALMWDKAWVWDITQCWSNTNLFHIFHCASSTSNHLWLFPVQVGLPKPSHRQAYLVKFEHVLSKRCHWHCSRWYYMVELTFYWSLFFSQFVDVKRKVAVKILHKWMKDN